jgi:acyl-coenzyme A synthetase/AMP-(fatty) acid ligase
MSRLSVSEEDHVDPRADAVDDVVADFAAAVRTWSDLPAILENGSVITYGAFAARVRRTALRYGARRLSAGGPSGLIGVEVSHASTTVEHLLGVLAAGAAYCPIDAALPVARKESIVETLGLDSLFAATDDPDEPHGTDAEHPLGHRSDPAYVLCTSGSTGAPKPVVVSRYALTVTVRALRLLFALSPEDRVLQFASLGWDTCFEEILPALTSGATLVFDDAAHCGTFPPFLRMVAERRVTVLDLPTAFWHELVLYLDEEGTALPECVRLVVIGGERVDPTRLQQWRELDAGRVRLLNTYGCTETTMITHAVQLSGPDTEHCVIDDGEAPLGRPLPHVGDHVTDEGELLVSGPSLASGYLGLADFTQSAFPVADHGSGVKQWFHTGDIVTRGESGLLYARGRVDEQVKVLGVRVHPAEVEAQLTSHPAVAAAVVVGAKQLGRTTLIAYVVAATPTSPGELKQYLRDRLPRQFVPNQVKFVAALSYTASGKVDRTATRRAAESGREGAEQ